MYPRWVQPAERVSFRLKSQSTTFGRCKNAGARERAEIPAYHQ